MSHHGPWDQPLPCAPVSGVLNMQQNADTCWRERILLVKPLQIKT